MYIGYTRYFLRAVLLASATLLFLGLTDEQMPPESSPVPPVNLTPEEDVVAAVIPCRDMIDDGLFQSIKRRSQEAINAGATFLIYQIETYGGLVKSADDISKYFIQELDENVRTVAYITTEAISAGAWVSVSCEDIIMRENSKIGDCAPITLGGEGLEGVEREKTESFIRSAFQTAAEANNYPAAVLEAMVTQRLKVFQVKNNETGDFEYFANLDNIGDPNAYDLKYSRMIDDEETLITLTSSEALEYGVARAVVKDLNEALAWLEGRYNVTFGPSPVVYETTWSEELVRKINHPTVMGVLFMLMLLGIYIELNTPGLGLPGLFALICLIIIVGSKYLIGMANWIEIAVFVIGVFFLLLEILVIPGFGIAGVIGILFIFAGLFGMLIKNAPNEIPWPQTDLQWSEFMDGVLGLVGGLIGFAVMASIITRYLPRMGIFSGLILAPSLNTQIEPRKPDMTAPPEYETQGVQVGDIGRVLSPLRPCGTVRFGETIVDVVARAEFLQKGDNVRILEIHGNRVVVGKIESE